MKEELTHKLRQITDVWNYYILKHEFCNKKIKFTDEVKTNYFGDILGYFQDTLDIIFDLRESNSYTDRFSNQISLLQSIYVQQDFIEELLIIFKCKIGKGDLKKDSNYYINREIRNELVGHPIRKQKGEFISSCLFGYNGGSDKIVYLRYHKENNYEFESMKFLVSEVIKRHSDFLNTYFDKILNKLKSILVDYSKKIQELESLIEKKTFCETLNLLEVFYESIFEFDFIYDKESLLKIYDRKDEHKRYQNLIDKFYQDLRDSLKEKKENINKLFEPRKTIKKLTFEKPIFDIHFFDDSEIENNVTNHTINYNYELGKLATRRTPMDFDFFSNSLRSKFSQNEIIQEELNHMQSNIYNDIEYFTAYRLIRAELNEG